MSSVIARRLARLPSPAASRLILSARSYYAPSDPQLGDYPQLPWVSRQTLPPRGWQDEQMRRNFGETLHEQDEVLSMWGPDPAPLPPQEALKQLMFAALGFVGVGYLIKEHMVPELPAVRRQYPFDGLMAELGGLAENKARPASLDGDE